MLVREGRPRSETTISAPEAAFKFLRPKALRLDRECVWRIDLDARQAVIGHEVVSVGTLTASLVHPREVLKAAILANAAGFILGHNHPSGDPEPSTDDRETTRRIKIAGDVIGIPMLDHVIVAGDRYFSFRQSGLL